MAFSEYRSPCCWSLSHLALFHIFWLLELAYSTVSLLFFPFPSFIPQGHLTLGTFNALFAVQANGVS